MIAQVAESGRQYQPSHSRWSQLMRKACDIPGNTLQLFLQFVEVGCEVAVSIALTGKTTQTDREGAKPLCQVIVQFMSNAITFDFLRVNQLRTRLPQMFFRFSQMCEVNAATDITEKSAVGSVSRYAVMKHPSINAVVPQQPVFQGEVLSRFER